MKIYLSGSITSDPNYTEHFAKAKKYFLSKGFEVFDPTMLPCNLEYHEYMRLDLAELLECDYIYFVNDITTSKGAFIERIVAETCGIKEIT